MNNWQVVAKKKKLKPLSVNKNNLFCYANGDLYNVDYELKNPKLICKLPTSKPFDYIVKKNRVLDRVLRYSPNHTVILDDFAFILQKSKIWRCNLKTREISLDFTIPDNRRALELSILKNSNGSSEIIFGEYFFNPKRLSVRIWGRLISDGVWKLRGEFKSGEIEHIHSITKLDENILILTGDFEGSAGIWKANLNFSHIEPLFKGSQKYRAAWIKKFDEYFLYATDTQVDQNFLCKFNINTVPCLVDEILKIDGSSIYSAQSKDYSYFSTTVECGLPTGKYFKDVFETTPGPGIKSSTSSIISINRFGKLETVVTGIKDKIPFRLGQFGTFSFPTGELPPSTVVAYGIALKGLDDTCLVIRKDV